MHWTNHHLSTTSPLVLDYLAVESGGGKAIVVVISPLIALMEDQVASYSAKGIKRQL